MTYKEALEYLHSFRRLSPAADLGRIRRLLAALGNPQDSLKFLHIAGTNGKGSTAAFCASALTESGYRTGLFVSPFVIRFNERIQINGEYIPDDGFAAVMSEVAAAVGEGKDEYIEFEVLTAAAMLWFLQGGCDIVVLETGIGGRLDATNAVMTTVVAVITSISFDHTELLGDTLGAIAAEKAQIIKQGCTVICYPGQSDEALAAIMLAADEKRARLVLPDMQELTLQDGHFTYKGNDYIVTLRGEHQVYNAVTAIEALNELSYNGFYNITQEKLALGLMKTKMPARFEQVSAEPQVILDGAHNPSGMECLARVAAHELAGKRVTAVVAMMRDKNVRESVANLAGCVTKAIATKTDNPRCMDAGELCVIMKEAGIRAFAEEEPTKAIAAAEADGEADAVLVCGSLYLVSEVRKIFIA